MNGYIDLREMFPDMSEAVRAAVMGVLKQVYIALPVNVTKDTEDGRTVSVRPAVKGQIIKPDGSREFVEMPEMQDVTVQFSGGNGHHFTHPVKAGDEGFIIISSRNYDGWDQSGGTQQPVDARIGDLSDGHFVPGIHSQPKKIPNYSRETAQMRQGDRAESKVDVSSTGVLNKRGTDASAAKAHIMDAGVVVQKGEQTITAHLDDRIDKRSPKILMNCA